MLLKYYFNSIPSMGMLAGELYKSCYGVLFSENDVIDLRLYLGFYDSVVVAPQDMILVDSLYLNINSKLINFHDLKEVDLPHKVEGDIRGVSYIDESYIVFHERKSIRENFYLIFDKKNNRQIRIAGVGRRPFIDDKYIIKRNINSVICFNWLSEEIWKYESGKLIQGACEEIIDCGEDVIFNAGDQGNGLSYVVRLKKITGEALWRKSFDGVIDNSLLINNKIYVAQANKMVVLSAETADVELSFKVDLPSGEEGTTLWTDGKILYVLAHKSNRILCHSISNGSHIKTYILPVHPDLTCGVLPYVYRNKIYLNLKPSLGGLAGVEGGLLTWASEDVLSGKELEIEEKPFIINVIIKENDGSQSYYVNIPCDNIHDVLRFGEIEARKVAALRGKQMDDNSETRNKKFNGHIKLIIDPAVGEENRPYLDMLVRRATFFAKVMDIKSGNGKKPVEVSWAFSNEL